MPPRASARITAPTLVVTGEAALDHVAAVEGTSDYLRIIRGARGVVLEHTGHLGTITRPDAFAAAFREFAATLEPESRRSGPHVSPRLRLVPRDGQHDAA